MTLMRQAMTLTRSSSNWSHPRMKTRVNLKIPLQ